RFCGRGNLRHGSRGQRPLGRIFGDLHPLAVARNTDGNDVVLVLVNGTQNAGGGDAADRMLAGASAEKYRDAGLAPGCGLRRCRAGFVVHCSSPSDLSSRANSRGASSSTAISPSRTATTASVIGMSTPSLVARSNTARPDLMPSAVWVICTDTSSSVSPSPSRRPAVWLRDSGDEQVATRSPSPASPAMVCTSPPKARVSRVVSASPRVMTVALVLSPMPLPSQIPTHRAITFLTIPPISTPVTSGLVYGRK